MDRVRKLIFGLAIAVLVVFVNTPVASAEEGLQRPEKINLIVTGSRDNMVKTRITWSAVEGAQGYEVYCRRNPTGETYNLYLYDAWNEWELLGKTEETTYYHDFESADAFVQLRVRAYKDAEYGKFSDVRMLDLEHQTIATLRIYLDSSMKDLFVGEKFTLSLYYATDPVTWESSDKKIATVDDKGVVTAKKAGSCEIIATSGDIVRKCPIKVSKYTRANAYREELNNLLKGKGSGSFALVDIDQDGGKELLVEYYPDAASINTKLYIYTYKDGKLTRSEFRGYGHLEYYKESKCLKNHLMSYGSMSKDGKPGAGTIEYYTISKNKAVQKKNIKLKGKGTDIKPYLLNGQNIEKYITDKLK